MLGQKRKQEVNSLTVAIESGTTVDDAERSLRKLAEGGYLVLLRTVDGISWFGPTVKGVNYIRQTCAKQKGG